MSIPQRLKSERERIGLSQPQLGELVSAGKTTVINWEKGASAPDAEQLATMNGAGLDVPYILFGVRSQQLPPEATLPPDEQVLLDNYRNAPAGVKSGVKTTLRAFAPAPSGKRRAAG